MPEPKAPKPREVKVKSYHCMHCKSYWIPEDQDAMPKRCGHCKTPNWQKPKRDRPGRPATGRQTKEQKKAKIKVKKAAKRAAKGLPPWTPPIKKAAPDMSFLDES
jgi:hypothetical protein